MGAPKPPSGETVMDLTSPQPTPKRRWLRATLLTLVVVVTVFGCGLGYGLNWLRQRHEFEARENVQGFLGSDKKAWVHAPVLLKFFGEPGRAEIVLLFQAGQNLPARAEVELATRLFPEAEITVQAERTSRH
jgi:hypothetical protein